jgi:hypothetical protein
MTQQKTIFYEGQKVFCLIHGAGHVHGIDAHRGHGVRVAFDVGDTDYFTHDGRLCSYGLMPTLYGYEQYLEIKHIIDSIPPPEPERWKPTKGQFIWVTSDSDLSDMPVLRRFECMSTKGWYGCSHPRSLDIICNWKYAFQFKGELPECLKERGGNDGLA